MFAAIKLFFGKIFPDNISLYFVIGLFGLLAVVVLYNSDTILSRFGFETTSSLKERIAQLEKDNSALKQTNENLVNKMKTQEKNHDKELKALASYYENKMNTYKRIETINAQLKTKNEKLSRELEEQRTQLAQSCNLDRAKYYLYAKDTYDSISMNNALSINETLALKLDKNIEIKMYEVGKNSITELNTKNPLSSILKLKAN